VDGAVVWLGLVCDVVRGGVVRGAVVGRVLVAVRCGVVRVAWVAVAVVAVVVVPAVAVCALEVGATVLGEVGDEGAGPVLHAATRSTATVAPTRALLIPQD
jgi:hypothetical protein